MDVPGQVQIEILHRDHLAVSAAGCPSFDAERRPHTRLPDSGEDAMAQAAEPLAQTDSGGRLAFTEGSRRDGSDVDVLAEWLVCQFLSNVEMDLGLVMTEGVQVV